MKTVVLGLVLAATALLSPLAGQAGAHSATAAVASAAATATPSFARERVGYGDRDVSPSDIDHVRELQYRLRWAGVYDGPVTGYFGDLTQAAVVRYQKKVGLPATGVATKAVWRRLIPATIRGRASVPDACDQGRGWDACYDRARHETTLWRDGVLVNAWLVRGGSADLQTRTGDFRVFSRDIDHVSSLYGSPMPYSQFFSGGQAFHGSGTMVDPFSGHSHGCINMYVEDARQLWRLTSTVDLEVHVHGGWS
jgi:hypothetical protein